MMINKKKKIMQKRRRFHYGNDGRGLRSILLNGQHANRVVLADTERNIIKVIMTDKQGNLVSVGNEWKTMKLRGKVKVIYQKTRTIRKSESKS